MREGCDVTGGGGKRLGEERRLEVYVFLLLALQPSLDVFSYALTEGGWGNFLSTALRGLLLAFTLLLALLGTKQRKEGLRFLAFCAGMALFWGLHYWASRQAGLVAWRSDLLNYVKFAQLPLALYAWWLLLQRLPQRAVLLSQAAVAAFASILAYDFLAYVTGTGRLTYPDLHQGFTGWYNNANAQSNLLAILYPATHYALLRVDLPGRLGKPSWRRGIFLFFALFGGLRLFFFGTRVTFAALPSALLLLLFFLRKEAKTHLPEVLSLVGILFFTGIFYTQSPMYLLRQGDQRYAQEKQDTLLAEIGPLPEESREETAEERELRLERDPRVLALYNHYLPDLMSTFGSHKVLQVYDYSLDFTKLRQARLMKIQFARLRLLDSPRPVQLLGLNFEQMILPGKKENYDLESDYHALVAYQGLLGTALVLLPLLALAWRCLRYLLRSRGRAFLEDETFVLTGYLSGILIVAAVFGGSVLRRPSVSFPFAVILALLILSSAGGGKPDRRDEDHTTVPAASASGSAEDFSGSEGSAPSDSQDKAGFPS